MKAIDRRLRRLAGSFAPQENEEVARLVTLLRERRRRRAEQSGKILCIIGSYPAAVRSAAVTRFRSRQISAT